MLMRRRTDGSVRVGDRVVAVKPIGDIPEGMEGRVKVIDGFGWVRYWVAWDNGEWMGSVDSASVVRADRLEQWRAEQEAAQQAAAERAEHAAAGAATANGDGDGDAAGGGADSRVPEHLLERSRQARARKAAQAAG
ncbi:MAG TPA: hypothetical protein VMU14_01115 [Acidimicrobiales bacterium]|nr:hypothetical protein [Acidimicrobiales bacterium]